MKLTHENYDRTTVIGLGGEVTIESIDTFRKLVTERLEDDARDFVVDLTQTDFLDSSALESLLWVQEQADEKLGQVRLAGANEAVQKIMEITRLDKHFDRHDSVDAALKSLR